VSPLARILINVHGSADQRDRSVLSDESVVTSIGCVAEAVGRAVAAGFGEKAGEERY
jgi:hypothetical protein